MGEAAEGAEIAAQEGETGHREGAAAGAADSPHAARATARTGAPTPGATEAGAPEGGHGPAAGQERPGPYETAWLAPRWLAMAALAGAILWVAFTDTRRDAPRIELDRREAVATARAALAAGGADATGWEVVARLERTPDQAARFLWETSGAHVYHELLGTYVLPPRWRVRFVRFSGPVDDRAEEWRVRVGPRGDVLEVSHRLPEGRPGAALEEAEARDLAAGAVHERLGIDPEALREISAEARQRPARRDWTFTYGADDASLLAEGELRVAVEVAGDAAVAAHRFVHVPEAWEREERRRQTRALVVSLGSLGMLGLLMLGGVVAAVVVWSRGSFAPGVAAAVALSAAVVQGVGAVNQLPAIVADFGTAEPVRAQLLAYGVGVVVAVLVAAGGLGLMAGLAHTWLWRRPSSPARPAGVGLSAGILLAGLLAAAASLAPRVRGPDWPRLGGADAYLPGLAAALDPVMTLLATCTLLLLLVAAVHRVTDGWRRRRLDTTMTLLALGVMIHGAGLEMGTRAGPDLLRWIGGGVLIGAGLVLLYHLVLRSYPAVVPVLAAVVVAATQVERMLVRPFEGSAGGAAASLFLLAAVSWVWASRLLRKPAADGDAAPG